jgi:hypothetical protein
MDLDPTIGRPGTAGTSRPTTAIATDLRRGVTPPEVERESVARTTERATYGSPGFRPAGDATRDVVVLLSQKALTLAKTASNPAPRGKSIDREDDGAKRRVRPDGGGPEPSRRRIDSHA